MKHAITVLSVAAITLLHAGVSRADEVPSEHVEAAADKPQDSAAAKAAAFREPGRFGIVGAITSDGFQFGGARLGEHYEAVLTADASTSVLKGGGSPGGDLGITLRGGPRFGLGKFNYLSVGVQGHVSVFGKDNGVSTEGSFTAGPYVGVSRHFAGAPLVITLWVQPYEFEREVSNDGDGHRAIVYQHAFFQGGGFGLTYLL
ncbi:MAG: hypothetical protein JWP97_5242 [Labilithrix sp.]|nr:hypothetical protein [Labilithrix sp.]